MLDGIFGEIEEAEHEGSEQPPSENIYGIVDAEVEARKGHEEDVENADGPREGVSPVVKVDEAEKESGFGASTGKAERVGVMKSDLWKILARPWPAEETFGHADDEAVEGKPIENAKTPLVGVTEPDEGNQDEEEVGRIKVIEEAKDGVEPFMPLRGEANHEFELLLMVRQMGHVVPLWPLAGQYFLAK